MYSTPLHDALAALPPLSDKESEHSLSNPGIRALGQVVACLPDPPVRLGRRYALPFVLT